ncbi:MAG: MOSC domain-containing protein, partial [Alphaproteobacteria bacterium]|nr:MOSC domain-containing protein [Alphaproteobacteria bacterium]
CPATHVDPKTGQADADILDALRGCQGHTQMGVYADVKQGGAVRVGDEVEVL